MSNFIPARRVRRIADSPSTMAAARVRELKQQGRVILDLTVGEPDFDTPDDIKQAAKIAIDDGQTKYTSVNGTPQLRQAIRERLIRSHEQEYADVEITVGGGAKQLIFLAFMASLDEGDEVIVPSPYWVSYPDMVRANDGTPVIVDTEESEKFKLTPASLEQAISERTKWLILNTPSNPTGAAYTVEELKALAEVLRRHPHVRVLADEIYDEISYLGTRIPSLVLAAPDMRERTLVTNGVSKSYAMTGWRLGYAAGAASVIAAINKLQSQTSSCPSSISQAAAATALSGPDDFIASAVSQYKIRRDRALELLKDVPGLDAVKPDGAFYIYVSCAGLIGRTSSDGTVIGSDQEVTLYLLDEANVAVIQGEAYGRSPYFRMSIATDLATIEAAIAAIAEAVARLIPSRSSAALAGNGE